jgi:hypothetical protein
MVLDLSIHTNMRWRSREMLASTSIDVTLVGGGAADVVRSSLQIANGRGVLRIGPDRCSHPVLGGARMIISLTRGFGGEYPVGQTITGFRSAFSRCRSVTPPAAASTSPMAAAFN